MANEKHEVHLKDEERRKLLAIVSKGRNKAVVIQRAHILLKVDEGKTDAEISQMLYASEQTIRRTRLRFAQEGLQAALEDKPHPATGSELDDKQEARIIALACSDPPAGQARWTLELLTQEVLRDGIVTRISPETVRLLLKKTNSNPGREAVGAFRKSRQSSLSGWNIFWNFITEPTIPSGDWSALMKKACNCWQISRLRWRSSRDRLCAKTMNTNETAHATCLSWSSPRLAFDRFW
jgi:transposase